MNKTEKHKKPEIKQINDKASEKNKKNKKQPVKQKTVSRLKHANKSASALHSESRDKKGNKSLAPLLVVLIILLILTSYMAFSEKSAFLSNLFSRSSETPPLIERPEIIQNEIVKEDETETNSYTVTNEVEIKADPEKPQSEDNNPVPQKSIKSRLFYVKVSDEGQISLKSVIRNINYISTPLTETMKSLILGPDRADLNKGLLNLIPQDTVINSIKIAQGIAYIDFNESFRYNSLGVEGYTAQLMQIVYTATEFQTVKKVQILINGEKHEYLGAEGVYIGEPIDREYFNTF